MFTDILQPTHLIFVLVVALLVLGPKRLPEVGRSLGRGLRDFRAAMSGEEHDEVPAETPPMDLAPAEPAHQPAPAKPAEPATQPVAGPVQQPAAPTVQQPDEPTVQHPAEPLMQQPEPAQTGSAEQPEHVA